MNTTPAQHTLHTEAVAAYRWTVSGRVQGVGFRPFVYRLATRFELTGTVRNHGGVVVIEAQGPIENLAQFERALQHEAPAIARPKINHCEPIACDNHHAFIIESSAEAHSDSPHVTPDHPVCEHCLDELNDPGNRRYRYPFINCTQCGPRYTIIERQPYDRPNTSMAEFPLCPQCAAEYTDPNDRRFHAQPIACPHCGPQLQLIVPGQAPLSDNEEPLAAAVAALAQARIVAVKGIGGYHLMVDATNSAAIERLRQRKHRPHKPFAVMFPWRGADGCDAVREVAELNTLERDALVSTERPVVLCTLRVPQALPDILAPGLQQLGALLPYSPIHHLLLDAVGCPLLATSANLSGEPIISDNTVAEQRLANVADAFLHHNRPILRPADDGVVRVIAGRARPLRLGRGSAPLEMTLPFRVRQPVLALGGQQKNTLCLAWEDRVLVSPHLGDLQEYRAQQNFEHHTRALPALYGIEPTVLITDAHPDYYVTRWASAAGLPLQRVFHHHAHASALCGEHNRFDEDTLVFTWDGTGFGSDASLWGGEALLGRPGQWQHIASFQPFPLLGGEHAIREPWRMAAALCWDMGIAWRPATVSEEHYSLLHYAWQRRLNAPSCSAVGRLFDAASALLGQIETASFDAQAPMLLEATASGTGHAVALPHTLDENGVLRCDWQPLLQHLLDNRISVEQRAADFHSTLAEVLLTQAEYAREHSGIRSIGLSGGVFQNRRLTEDVIDKLTRAGFSVLLHEHIPCNDAGISYGQLMDCLPSLRQRECT